MRRYALCHKCTLDSVNIVATYLLGWKIRLFTALFLYIFLPVVAVGTAPGTRMTIAGYCSIVTVVKKIELQL